MASTIVAVPPRFLAELPEVSRLPLDVHDLAKMLKLFLKTAVVTPRRTGTDIRDRTSFSSLSRTALGHEREPDHTGRHGGQC